MKQIINKTKGKIADINKNICILGEGNNKTYYIVIPKPLVDSNVLELGKQYNFEIKEAKQ